jgi:hypothetical protein
VLKELPQEGRIQVFHTQFGWRPSKPFQGEPKQKSEGIPVGGYGIWACAELLKQSIGEETLNQ